jgi:hypothetical protein
MIRREVITILEYHVPTTTNLRRVGSLIDFLERNDAPAKTKDDILRAAVVFNYATLEEFLRYVDDKCIP